VYFSVNFNVFFKLIKVHLLVSELYIGYMFLYCGCYLCLIYTDIINFRCGFSRKKKSKGSI